MKKEKSPPEDDDLDAAPTLQKEVCHGYILLMAKNSIIDIHGQWKRRSTKTDSEHSGIKPSAWTHGKGGSSTNHA